MRCVLTWKILGIKSRPILYLRAQSMRHTEEKEFGLLPTVKLTDAHPQRILTNGKNISQTTGTQYGLHLTQMAASGMLPTPTAMDSTNATANMKSTQVKEGSMHSMTLTRMMSEGMLPTPTAQIIKHGHSDKYWDNQIGNRQMDLAMWNAETNGKTSQLNPRFVAEMMGFPVTICHVHCEFLNEVHFEPKNRVFLE